jgi:hypothetical protein
MSRRPPRLLVESPSVRWRPPARDPEVARFLLPQPRLASPSCPRWRPDAGHVVYQLLGYRVITVNAAGAC